MTKRPRAKSLPAVEKTVAKFKEECDEFEDFFEVRKEGEFIKYDPLDSDDTLSKFLIMMTKGHAATAAAVAKIEVAKKVTAKYNLKVGTPVKVIYRSFPYIGRFRRIVPYTENRDSGRDTGKVWYEVEFCGAKVVHSERHIQPIAGLTEELS